MSLRRLKGNIMKINNFDLNAVFFTLMLTISVLITIILHAILKINNPGVYWCLGAMFTAAGIAFK